MLPLFDRTTRLPGFLEDALARGAVVLTANLRAARALETLYAEDQRDRGLGAWPRPRLLDWHTWVAELWEQYARRAEDAPMPLSALQEHQVWKQAQGADRDRVVAPERMADLAQEAYGLLGSYRAHALSRPGSLFDETHEDAEHFLAWAASFDRKCRQQGWISRTRLEETLAGSLHLLDPVAEVCLVGFDRTTPAQAWLLKALGAAGTTVSRPETAQALGKPKLLRAKDERQELEACAWWCRAQLAEDSARRIGVIVPDLGRARADLDRVFRRILMPQTTFWPDAGPVTAEPALPYEFSLGTSLGTIPIVRAALLLLRWLTTPLAAAEFTWLMTGGYLAASAADQLALSRLDARLRQGRRSGPQVPLSLLTHGPGLSAELRTRLLRSSAQLAAERRGTSASRSDASTDRRASYAHWAELAPSLLAEAGWPGYREIDSFTFQTQQRWTRLLGELAELGFDGSKPTWEGFLSTLEAEARSIIFAAESTSPPIQILGAFESSGQSFDALWFLGADDGHWPAVGRPHPLLPGWLQREAGMPHASPQADWLLAQEATARIVTAASVVVMSYAAVDKMAQGVPQRPSPLLPAHGEAFELVGPPSPTLKPVLLSVVEDDAGTLAWPTAKSAGGAEVLRRQAACAFQSFATRRLEARPLEEAAQGLDPAERGVALHRVLEHLWSPEEGDPLRLHSHADLRRTMADGSIHAMLAHHIGEVFAQLRSERPADPWQNAYLACEQQRVQERLLVWLGCELERHPFTIAALEKRVDEMMVGSLKLAARLDRVDRLADGSHLLIDYKTGKVQAGAWMGARPEEPQLPLYAVFGGIAEVSGVAFAQIRADETKLLARAADAAAMISAKLGAATEENLYDDEVRDAWREALLALAEEFTRGEANVNPRDGAKTCRYCPLAGLCRVHASGLLGDEDEDGDDRG